MSLPQQVRLVSLLSLLSGFACQARSGPSTSSSTHWIQCDSDADCANLPAPATCGADGYCVDGTSLKIERELSYEAEFSSDGWDAEALGFETGYQIRNEDDQFYTDREQNVFLRDGELVLVARAETYDAAQYTSGSVQTRGLYDWVFGRIEASILAPIGRGAGPSFWMLPVEPGAPEYACVDDGTCFENTWPAWGDITIMAARSENPDQVMMGINYATDDGSGGLTHLGDFAEVPVTPTVAADYHVYAIEWGPQRIDWFLDDELVRSVDLTDARIYHPSGQNPFHRSFYLKLSLAVGGLTEPPVAADYPQEMRVRWVRVWQVE